MATLPKIKMQYEIRETRWIDPISMLIGAVLTLSSIAAYLVIVHMMK